MIKKQKDLFIGTHTRVILSDWKILADLITEHAFFIRERTQPSQEENESTFPKVLSRREIEDALEGPLQGFFKQKISAYLKIVKVRMHLNIMEDEMLKDHSKTLSEEEKVPTRILQNISLSDLTKIQQTLDPLTTEHAEQWKQSREQWNQEIVEALNKQDLALSEIEIKEFLDPEPISELLNRFVHLNIDLPKTRQSEMGFSKYLALKATITIQSALSRQHLPHDQPTIQKTLNKLKSDFNFIAKQESEILETQKNATDQVVVDLI